MAKRSDTEAALFGARVRRARKALGISQAELARRAGYTRQGVSLIEKGRTGVSGPGRASLAQALGVPVATLIAPPRRRSTR